MTLAAKPFAPYRALPEGQRVCGPTFAGSSDLGGADADFIGGTLIDCKATTQPRQPARTSCTSSPDLDRRGTKELTGRVGELQAEVQRVKDELAASVRTTHVCGASWKRRRTRWSPCARPAGRCSRTSTGPAECLFL